MRDLTTVMDSFKYDTETCVVIIKGQGKHFCVGAGLKDPDREPTDDNNSLIKRTGVTQVGRDLISSILNLNQISIAAVQAVANSDILHMDGDQFTLATESEDYENVR